MNIYTKTGDTGTTALFGGTRVNKSHQRLESYGTIDELTAHLGLVSALGSDQSLTAELAMLPNIQAMLMIIASHLATPYTLDTIPSTIPSLPSTAVSNLEQAIDHMETTLPPLKNFILPGGSIVGAQLHITRTVARRAERAVIRLSADSAVLPEILTYLNRLSDYLFVLARYINMKLEKEEDLWNTKDTTIKK
jgi:cob(I)alamin adenosyltransferase